MGGGVQETFPIPPRSFLSLVTGAQHIPEKAKGNGGGRKTGSMYKGRREAEPSRSASDQHLSEGSGSQCTEALGLWVDMGRDYPLPLWTPSLVRQVPYSVMWGGRGREENRGFRWVLVEENGRGLGKGDVLQSSVIPLALSSSCTRVR